jgi:hypothetical protein
MSLFSLYGIKEVADVTFWTTDKNPKPVLYLDTLKVSTIEETGEQAEARGGKGNAPLIIWDYGKEITLTLEDALFSMKSMQIMQGAKKVDVSTSTKKTKIDRTGKGTVAKHDDSDTYYVVGFEEEEKSYNYYDEKGKKIATLGADHDGTIVIVHWVEELEEAESITISSSSFPGTYRITGDTFARNQATGKDEFFQFIIPLAKVNPEQTITMQADGDPSTFSMTVRVLRPADGNMMQLIKYPKPDLEAEAGE